MNTIAAMKRIITSNLERLTSVAKDSGGLQAHLWIAGMLMLPVILHIPLYMDDYRRSISGDFDWHLDGRPLATLISMMLSFGHIAAGISPLMQLISIPLIAITSAVCARSYGIRSNWLGALAVMPVFFFPYFLENLSYGFDCISMVLSQAFALLSALLILRPYNTSARRTMLAFVLLLAAINLYQPALSSFMAFFLVDWIFAIFWPSKINDSMSRRRICLVRIMLGLGVYVTSLLAYRLIIGINLIQLGAWQQEMATLLALDSKLAAIIAGRIRDLWIMLATDWSATALPYLLALQLFCFVLIIGFKQTPKTVLAAGLVLLAVTAAIGPQYLLVNLFNPDNKGYYTLVARMLGFIGVTLAAVNLNILRITDAGRPRLALRKNQSFLVAAPLFLISWFYVFFAYTYGHAYQAQREYESGKISRLVNDLAILEAVERPTQRATAIAFNGKMPQSPTLQISASKYPVLARMIPQMIDDDWYWGHMQVRHAGMDNLAFHKWQIPSPEVQEVSCSAGNARCSSEYNIVLHKSIFYVRVKP